MKSMKKIKTGVIASLLVTILISILTMSAYAAPNSIQLGSSKKVSTGYIAGVTFYTKETTDGQYLYCLNMHKKTSTNIRADLVKQRDNGIATIIKNGYPYKSITGDADKDYYITQTAVWWYLDDTTGSSNLGDQFKTNGSDAYGLRAKVKELVELGKKHKNDSAVKPEIEISAGSESLSFKNDYFISEGIKATKLSNVSSYTVTLEGAPEGTKIVDENGNELKSFKKDTVFYVKVPATGVNKTDANFSVKATASLTNYSAYEYQPTDSAMQNVALLVKEPASSDSKINFSLESTKISITKIDSKTKNAIEGAELTLKDKEGKVYGTWTSTTNAHVFRNLPYGTYIIEETKAPNGYVINKRVTEVTLSETNNNIDVKIENAPQSISVSITKVDSATGNALAGAVIVIKKENGEIVKRFTSTTEATVFTDLEYGTYIVYEESAPEGYVKSNEEYRFTLDENNMTYQITIDNTKETIVPDTASGSLIITLIGLMIIGSGIAFIYKNGKKAK